LAIATLEIVALEIVFGGSWREKHIF